MSTIQLLNNNFKIACDINIQSTKVKNLFKHTI